MDDQAPERTVSTLRDPKALRFAHERILAYHRRQIPTTLKFFGKK